MQKWIKLLDKADAYTLKCYVDVKECTSGVGLLMHCR